MSLVPLKVRIFLRKMFPTLFPLEPNYASKARKDVFKSVYETGAWGNNMSRNYYSGAGSHNPAVVSAYVNEVRSYLVKRGLSSSACDIGCGDFSVGSKIRPFFRHFTGVDIFKGVLEENMSIYSKDPELEFLELDICEQPAPHCDVIFVRQVFQHLDNLSICKALSNLAGRAKYLIISEHLPLSKFTPNLDKPSGESVRLAIGSGVVVTEAPFDMQCYESEVICQVREGSGVIVTTAYRL